MNYHLLIRNAIQTPDGTILESEGRYDYVTHTDANGKVYMVDGGLEYIRRSANGDEIDLSLYDDEPHSVQREILKWGTYGKNGNDPLKFVSVGDMSSDHIIAVLDNVPTIQDVIQNCMRKELDKREVNYDHI